jgi:hypothetical protein
MFMGMVVSGSARMVVEGGFMFPIVHQQPRDDKRPICAKTALFVRGIQLSAEDLRFFKRAMFGQRRERYALSPDQTLLFVPEAV